MPLSAAPRMVWMPWDIELSCCAMVCAALTTPIRADVLSGLVPSACTAVVRLLKAFSSVPVEFGSPYRLCSCCR